MAGSGNAVAVAVHGRLGVGKLGPGRAARVAGRLYAIADPDGWYPALVPGEGWVQGFVHEAGPDFDDADLAAMDGYEAFIPGDPQASDYVRAQVAVVLADGGSADSVDLRAETYLWAQDLPAGALPIASGDFARFLRERGVTAYCLGQ